MARVSNWGGSGNHPILLNPTIEEIVQFAQTERIDTLRICWDGDNFALASGYGNTHNTVTQAGRKLWGRRWFPYNAILYKTGQDRWAWNMLDGSDGDRVSFEKGLRLVPTNLANAVRDIVKIHDERYSHEVSLL